MSLLWLWITLHTSTYFNNFWHIICWIYWLLILNACKIFILALDMLLHYLRNINHKMNDSACLPRKSVSGSHHLLLTVFFIFLKLCVSKSAKPSTPWSWPIIWKKKELFRSRRKSAEIYSKCPKWWALSLTYACSQVGKTTLSERHLLRIRAIYLLVYIPITTSRNDPESNPRRSGLPTLMIPAKPLFPTRLTESNESITIDLVYVLQDERYASVSWISCIYRVLSYKMCVKWSNMK